MAVHLHNCGLDGDSCFNEDYASLIVIDPSIPLPRVGAVCLVQLSHYPRVPARWRYSQFMTTLKAFAKLEDRQHAATYYLCSLKPFLRTP